MTTKSIELNERKKKILEAIIRDYLHTAEPVGSRTIWRSYMPELSPATIRNEMADLEASGFITQPHTSAGRIPTDLGYRYYVDHLMKTRPLTPKEEEIIRENFKKASNELEEVLHQALKALSCLLEYASVIATLGNKIRIYSRGLSHMLKQPEFTDLRFTRKIIETLEEEDLIAALVKNYTAPHEITIHIGHENYFKEVKELSVVMGSYQIKNYITGGLGVIGPTRMSYARTVSILKRISQYLEGEKEASTNG